MRLVTASSSILIALAACSSSPSRKPGSCDGPCPASNIRHLVVVVQENHTFDNYFARYCTAPTGSAPTCTQGRQCCEAGPLHEPSGAAPILLDDAANASHDPDHTKACELAEANGGAMDRYVTGAGSCSDPRHFAYADETSAGTYWGLADAGALADHYFQPIAGQSSANDMYFARAQFVFDDNDDKPDAIGSQCSIAGTPVTFTDPTIGDLLTAADVSWAFYAEGYQAMLDADGLCPRAPEDCPFGLNLTPCDLDVADVPFDYFASTVDNPTTMRDFAQLARDLHEVKLPQVVFVKPLGYHSEHPGEETTISDGEHFVSGVVDAVAASEYAPDTLVLVTWDEGGGYYDHVAPPGLGADGKPYGTRVPLIALGPFAAAHTISHVQLEHSSIVKLIEWNWLGMQTGQLGGRDAVVANLGSMLDAAATGTAVPP